MTRGFLAKILLFSSLFFGSYFSSQAQIQVGSAERPTLNQTGRLTKEMLQELKNTTTLFVLLDRDYERIDAFQQAIGKVWKFTPFKIIRRTELSNYLQEGKYSFCMFGGYIVTARTSQNTHLTYDLGMLRFNKKGDVKGMDYFARMILSPEANTMFDITDATAGLGGHGGFPIAGNSRQEKAEGMNALYAEGSFYDWSPGFLMGKLHFINKMLTEGETFGNFSELTDQATLAGLSRDTLFIPDYVNLKWTPYRGTEQGKVPSAEEVREVYPYQVQFISTEALDQRLLSGGKPIYYLVSTLSSTDKHINIYNSQKGRLYAEYTPASYEFKMKDLKKVAKIIKTQ